MCRYAEAFVAGGLIPAHRRGRVDASLVALWDWYATFGALGGLSAEEISDAAAKAASLPPIDSVDMSGWLLGGPCGNTNCGPPPRTEIALGSCANDERDPFCQGVEPGPTVVKGLIAAINGSLYKLLIGSVPLDCTTGPNFPNGSKLHCPPRDCGAVGCLFNLTAAGSQSSFGHIKYARIIGYACSSFKCKTPR